MNYLKIFVRNTIFANHLHDIFGVGEVVGSAVSAGTSVATTSMTNEANKEIAQMNNETAIQIHKDDMQFNAEEAEKSRDFNAQEAEKNRQFNSQEAQKAREWNSETAIKERRKEAGLNTAMTDGGQGGSTISASGSPASSSPTSAPSAPTLSTPHLQTPDIAGAINAGINLAKASSEISGNKAEAEKDLQETKQSIEETRYKSILNSLTPQKIQTEIEDLKSKINFTNQDKDRIRAITAKEREYLDSAMMQGYNEWVKNEVAKGQLNLEQNKFIALFSQHQQDVRTDARKFAEDWRKRDYENSYKFGSYSSKRNQYTDMRTSSNDYGEGLRTSFGSSIPSTSLSEEQNTSLGSNYGVNETSDYKFSNLRNTIYYQQAVEAEACLYILTNHKEDKRAVKSALNRIQMINTSVQAYSLVLNEIKGIRKFRENDNQDFEDQQQ